MPTIGTQLSINIKPDPKLQEDLQQIVDEGEFPTLREMLTELVRIYKLHKAQGGQQRPVAPPQPRPVAAQPSPGENVFHAPYSEGVADYVKAMRRYFLENYDCETDRDTLKKVVQWSQLLTKKRMYMVRVSERTSQLIEQNAAEDISTELARDESHWIAQFLAKNLSAPQQKKPKEENPWW